METFDGLTWPSEGDSVDPAAARDLPRIDVAERLRNFWAFRDEDGAPGGA
jgi:hypothetical protein